MFTKQFLEIFGITVRQLIVFGWNNDLKTLIVLRRNHKIVVVIFGLSLFNTAYILGQTIRFKLAGDLNHFSFMFFALHAMIGYTLCIWILAVSPRELGSSYNSVILYGTKFRGRWTHYEYILLYKILMVATHFFR